jgi:hypothetical protein
MIEPVYLPWVIKAFQLVRINHKILNSGPEDWILGTSGLKPLSVFTFRLAISKVDKAIREDRAKLRVNLENAIVQLTARCAGFLEVTYLNGEAGKRIGPNSLVQYYHRTAKDFLETEFCRSKLKMPTVDADFEPLAALIISCILVLENEQIMAEVNEGYTGGPRSFINDMVKSAMVYAYYTECHPERYEERNALLPRLFSAMDQSYLRLKEIPNWTIGIWNCDTTLELATRYGLGGYLIENIRQPGSPLGESKVATMLLCRLLPSYRPQSNFPLPALRIVSLLLGWGAKVNEDPDSPTSTGGSAWENTVCYAATQIAQTGKTRKHLHIRYIEILTTLVGAGADLKVMVGGYRSGPPIYGMVVKCLEPLFPNETAPLLKEIGDALDKLVPHPRALIIPPSLELEHGRKRPLESIRSQRKKKLRTRI